MKIFIMFCFIFTVFFSKSTDAQTKRNLINEGVNLYKDGKFADAEVNFKKGLEKDANLFEGHFNLGDAYYKQGRYDESLQAFKNSLSFTDDKYKQSKVYHNIGNALLKSQKLKESIGAYANALKLNPNDLETKYNLSYALNMMKQNQDQNKQNQDKNNQDQNKDKDQNQDQNQQNKNQQNKDQNKQDQQQDQQQQRKDQMTKEEAERILDAMKNNEQDLQKKLRQVKGRAVVVEKDW